jgi:hypothetical protein
MIFFTFAATKKGEKEGKGERKKVVNFHIA